MLITAQTPEKPAFRLVLYYAWKILTFRVHHALKEPHAVTESQVMTKNVIFRPNDQIWSSGVVVMGTSTSCFGVGPGGGEALPTQAYQKMNIYIKFKVKVGKKYKVKR